MPIPLVLGALALGTAGGLAGFTLLPDHGKGVIEAVRPFPVVGQAGAVGVGETIGGALGTVGSGIATTANLATGLRSDAFSVEQASQGFRNSFFGGLGGTIVGASPALPSPAPVRQDTAQGGGSSNAGIAPIHLILGAAIIGAAIFVTRRK